MQEKHLKSLFLEKFGFECDKITLLPASGSARRYYRIHHKNGTIIGVYNQDKKENKAFIEFTNHFASKKLKVPNIIAEDYENSIYLQDDLGDITLFAYLTKLRSSDTFEQDIKPIYKSVIQNLIKFQTIGNIGLNYSYAYPRDAFDKQSMQWDLNYFKYFFLKLAQIPYDEQKLENDFTTFVNYLISAPYDYFMYRDFQSRNIMIKDNEVYFIDYQGGRKGALAYDLASLLYDSKADLSNSFRNEMLDFYISELKKIQQVDSENFKEYYFSFVLIRIMQAFGAYGYRGYYERKSHFLLSIPYALKNLKWILEEKSFPIDISYLKKTLWKMIESPKFITSENKISNLKVSINSFSFKRGIPYDNSGNGGGYVFDCRALPNPGREKEFKIKTGLDLEVQDYLKKHEEVDSFCGLIQDLASSHIDNYIERGFLNLSINFGCTGGQHRSVYCAEKTYEILKMKYPNISFEINHKELEKIGNYII